MFTTDKNVIFRKKFILDNISYNCNPSRYSVVKVSAKGVELTSIENKSVIIPFDNFNDFIVSDFLENGLYFKYDCILLKKNQNSIMAIPVIEDADYYQNLINRNRSEILKLKEGINFKIKNKENEIKDLVFCGKLYLKIVTDLNFSHLSSTNLLNFKFIFYDINTQELYSFSKRSDFYILEKNNEGIYSVDTIIEKFKSTECENFGVKNSYPKIRYWSKTPTYSENEISSLKKELREANEFFKNLYS